MKQVYRLKYVIHVERITRDKINGSAVQIGISPSNCVITELAMDKSRKRILARKNRETAGTGKVTEVEMD